VPSLKQLLKGSITSLLEPPKVTFSALWTKSSILHAPRKSREVHGRQTADCAPEPARLLRSWSTTAASDTPTHRRGADQLLDALPWLSAPNTGMPLVALIVNPARPHWVWLRGQKRRPKSFTSLIKPRQALRQQLVQ
jgi:hypothetical protein